MTQYHPGAGLPAHLAEEAACVADLLACVHIWSDVTCMFGEPERHAPGLWKVPIGEGWSMLFRWQQPYGPIDTQLHHEDYG